MIRVVLDTNIFISGIFWNGNYCSQIIELWRNGKIELVSSIEIIEELVKTLRDFKIKMTEDMIEEWRNMIIENAVIVVPQQKINIIKEDPDDNKFLDASISGKAKFIVSQDKHLLNLVEFKDIKIISPKEFIAKFI